MYFETYIYIYAHMYTLTYLGMVFYKWSVKVKFVAEEASQLEHGACNTVFLESHPRV